MTTTPKVIPCPTCKKQIAWSKENPYRPFCSDRCKLIDLGEWAAEKHRIQGEEIMKEDNEDTDDSGH